MEALYALQSARGILINIILVDVPYTKCLHIYITPWMRGPHQPRYAQRRNSALMAACPRADPLLSAFRRTGISAAVEGVAPPPATVQGSPHRQRQSRESPQQTVPRDRNAISMLQITYWNEYTSVFMYTTQKCIQLCMVLRILGMTRPNQIRWLKLNVI